MCRRRPRCSLDLGIRRIRPAKADVLARRRREDDRVLRHQSDGTPEIRPCHVGQRHAVQCHLAHLRIINRIKSCRIVVLPAPEGPTSATVSPGATRKETPTSAEASGRAG